MRDRECSSFGGFIKGVVIGGLIGAGAALLLTPQTGEETRRQIKEKSKKLKKEADKMVDAAMETWEENKEDWQKKIMEVSGELEKKASHFSSFLEDEKDRAEETILTAGRAIKDIRNGLKENTVSSKPSVEKEPVRSSTPKAPSRKEDSDVELARKILSKASGRSFYKKSERSRR